MSILAPLTILSISLQYPPPMPSGLCDTQHNQQDRWDRHIHRSRVLLFLSAALQTPTCSECWAYHCADGTMGKPFGFGRPWGNSNARAKATQTRGTRTRASSRRTAVPYWRTAAAS
ncbi:hypothetical protein B0H10DRAFT_1944442 [Mycena sp. CBHHK59/15]|nr:hypothetical protein B0H10DRAFT_1944442 [Mycena sp. CBHHK59/15]